ncbi:HNH endonuclease signature motif containing protein [Sulfuricurvum sp.]|uniref:HNH endonuclease n=1 Tax=Sulfuricurvum sp. TaxID=2025608 RepID=UPI002D24F4DB|nr:HNH endonuclease signature motif containing protein [Sulfuricurvum sp.]HZF69386.1 HNH endonuclease signature motif containing protein [Sulfuricurvum sp.]
MKHKKNRISLNLKHRLVANGVKVIDESVTLRRVFEKHGGICQGCQDPTVLGIHPQVPKSATIEHIIPISMGGEHTWENVTLLCYECNRLQNEKIQKQEAQRTKTKSLRLLGYEITIQWRAA